MKDGLTEWAGRSAVIDRGFVLRGGPFENRAGRGARNPLRRRVDMGLGNEGLKRKGYQKQPGDGTPSPVTAPDIGKAGRSFPHTTRIRLHRTVSISHQSLTTAGIVTVWE